MLEQPPGRSPPCLSIAFEVLLSYPESPSCLWRAVTRCSGPAGLIKLASPDLPPHLECGQVLPPSPSSPLTLLPSFWDGWVGEAGRRAAESAEGFPGSWIRKSLNVKGVVMFVGHTLPVCLLFPCFSMCGLMDFSFPGQRSPPVQL